MFIYPSDLSAKPKIWLWELRDIAILVIATIISAFALTQTGILIPLVLTFAYGILSIQVEGSSISSFIKDATIYFLLKQQRYDWGT